MIYFIINKVWLTDLMVFHWIETKSYPNRYKGFLISGGQNVSPNTEIKSILLFIADDKETLLECAVTFLSFVKD